MSLFRKLGRGLKKIAPVAVAIGAAYLTGGASLALQAASRKFAPTGAAGEELIEAAATASSGTGLAGMVKDYGAQRLYQRYGGVNYGTSPVEALDAGDVTQQDYLDDPYEPDEEDFDSDEDYE